MSREMNAKLEARGFGGSIAVAGEGWWPRFKVGSPPVPANLFTSLLRQSFNAHGLLLGASLNLNLAHLEPSIKTETLDQFDSALADVRSWLDAPDPASELKGAPIQPTFAVR
jgi:hypothetical protein